LEKGMIAAKAARANLARLAAPRRERSAALHTALMCGDLLQSSIAGPRRFLDFLPICGGAVGLGDARPHARASAIAPAMKFFN
jgi:hypothetical protein